MAALTKRLTYENIAAIYASPTARTKETAQTVAEALGLEVKLRDTLVDIDYGDWSTSTPSQIAASNPETWEKWLRTPQSIQFPNGGSLEELRVRVESCLAQIRADHVKDTVLLVTHESPIITTVCIALDLDDSYHLNWHMETGSVTVLDMTEHASMLIAVNDTCHLRNANA